MLVTITTIHNERERTAWVNEAPRTCLLFSDCQKLMDKIVDKRPCIELRCQLKLTAQSPTEQEKLRHAYSDSAYVSPQFDPVAQFILPSQHQFSFIPEKDERLRNQHRFQPVQLVPVYIKPNSLPFLRFISKCQGYFFCCFLQGSPLPYLQLTMTRALKGVITMFKAVGKLKQPLPRLQLPPQAALQIGAIPGHHGYLIMGWAWRVPSHPAPTPPAPPHLCCRVPFPAPPGPPRPAFPRPCIASHPLLPVHPHCGLLH